MSDYPRIGGTMAANVWSRILKTDPALCWPWLGGRVGRGYAQTRLTNGGKSFYVHRFVYEEAFGPIPDGMEIDHTCAVKHCCNPAHLEVVTRAENMRRIFDRAAECKRGHPRLPENTVTVGKQRRCLPCLRLNRRESKRRIRERYSNG